MNFTLCLIILILNTTALFGMEKAIAPYKNINIHAMTNQLNASATKRAIVEKQLPNLPSTTKSPTEKEQIYITRTIDGFNAAVKEYERGDKEIAAFSLLATYRQAEQNNTLSWVNYTTLEKIHKYISVTQAEKRLDLAIEFAEKTDPKHCTQSSETILANLYRKKGKDELFKKNYTQAKKWHEKALVLFKKTVYPDKYTKKRYQATFNQYVENLTALAENGDMEAQRSLAYMYTSCEYNDLMGPDKTDKSIECHKQYLLSMATLSCENHLPQKHFTIASTLKISCPSLSNYFNFFSARLINDNKKIKEICSAMQTLSPQEILVFQALSGNPAYLKEILEIMPHDQRLNTLLNDFNKKLLIQELSLDSNKNGSIVHACNYLLGLNEFSQQNYTDAYRYFMQCDCTNEHFLAYCLAQVCQTLSNVSSTESTFDNQILPAQSPTECNKRLLTKKDYTSAYRLMQSLFQTHTMEQATCVAFMKIETDFMEESTEYQTELTQETCRNNIYNNLKKLIEKKTHSAEVCHCLGHLYAQQATNKNNNPTLVKSLKKKSLSLLQCTLSHGTWSETDISSIQSTCLNFATDLSDYCHIYQLKQSTLPTKNNSLRRSIEKLLSGKENESFFDRIIHIMPDDQLLLSFFEADGLVAIPLLSAKLASLPDQNSSHADALRYIIALYEYSNKNYINAHTLFSQCTHYNNDLLIKALTLETAPIQQDLVTTEHIASLMAATTQTKKMSARDELAQLMIINLIKIQSEAYAQTLLSEKKYVELYRLIYTVIQQERILLTGINILLSTEDTFLKETNKTDILNNPYYANVHTTLQKIASNNKNHSFYLCHCLGTILAHNATYSLGDENEKNNLKKQSLRYFSCALNHKNNKLTEEEINLTRTIQSRLAQQLGETANARGDHTQALAYTNDAIAYGSAEALFDKACLLMNNSSHYPTSSEEIIDLLEKHANSNASNRILSCIPLIERYVSLNSVENEKKLLHYLAIADKLDNYQYTFWLGHFYQKGIENHLEKNLNLALYYYKKYLTFNNNDIDNISTITKAFINIAHILYEHNNIEEAYSYIQTALTLPLETKEEMECQWLAGCLKMLLTKNKKKPEGLEHFRQLYEKILIHDIHPIIDPKTQECIVPMLYMTSDALITADSIVSKILSENDSSPESLEWCYILGYFFCDSAKDAPINSRQRMLGIACLKHAAKKMFNALFYLLSTKEGEYKCCEKLYSLQTASNIPHHIPGMTDTIKEIISMLSPQTLKGQADFIRYIISHNNNPLLKTYLSTLYQENKPYVDTIDDDEIKKMIELCLNNECIKENAHNFLKTLTKSTPLEHNAATFLGSLLSCSRNEQDWGLSIRYLQTVYDTFPFHKLILQQNLGRAYYKLGHKYFQKNCYKPLLAVAYLEKAVKIFHIDSIILLSTQWLSNNPETKRFDNEAILSWLIYATSIETNPEASSLLKQYRKKYPLELGCKDPHLLIIPDEKAVRKIADNATLAAKKAYQQEQKEKEIRNHPAYNLLINSTHSLESNNKEFMKGVEIYKTSKGKDTTLLEKLSTGNNPDQHASIFLATCYFQQETTLDRAKDSLLKGIVNGLIKSPQGNHTLFMYDSIINMVFLLIDTCMLNPQYKIKGKILLKYLKNILLKNNVNTTAFAELFEVSKNKNISKNPSWK